MLTSNIIEGDKPPVSNQEEIAQLQQSITNQHHQAKLVLKEFFQKQDQFHNEIIGKKISLAFTKLLTSPLLSVAEIEAIGYYQSLYAELKYALTNNPFTTHDNVGHQMTEELREVYTVCSSPRFDEILSACEREQAEIYAPCNLLLQAILLKHPATEIMEGCQE